MTDTLHTRYRPAKFNDVLGQGHFIKKLTGFIANRSAHAYMFHGPSGCGKTTLARICATKLGCSKADILEVDGATNNGVEHTRHLQEITRYKPVSGGDAIAVIIDECHRITSAAYDTLLKVIEEPPPHLFWFLCTTEPTKVPVTIRNRCQQFAVREVPPNVLAALLTRVAKADKIDLPDDILEYIAAKSGGSPRRALVNLERCDGVTTRKEAAVAMEQVLNEDAVLELCRFLCSTGSKPWAKAMDIVTRITGTKEAVPNAEGIRIMVVHYIAACLKKASDEEALGFLPLLECFSQPFLDRDGNAALMLALGRALLADK